MSDTARSLALLIARISTRVRPVVPDRPQEEFDQLVRRMAEVELKYVLRAEEEPVARLTPPLGVDWIPPRD